MCINIKQEPLDVSVPVLSSRVEPFKGPQSAHGMALCWSCWSWSVGSTGTLQGCSESVPRVVLLSRISHLLPVLYSGLGGTTKLSE